MFSSLRRRVQEVVVPHSLVLEESFPPNTSPFPSSSHAPIPPPQSIANRLSLLQPCDIILITTPGTFYSFFRFISGHSKRLPNIDNSTASSSSSSSLYSPPSKDSASSHDGFDHLAILLSPTQFLHIGPPVIRVLPTSLLLLPHRHPVVLRPHLSPSDQRSLLYELNRIVGVPYDLFGVYRFLGKLSVVKMIHSVKDPKGTMATMVNKVTNKFNKNSGSQDNPNITNNNSLHIQSSIAKYSSFICTDAILTRLVSSSETFRNILKDMEHKDNPTLDYFKLQSFSINDVIRIHHAYPQLLERVDFPPYSTNDYKEIEEWSKMKRRGMMDFVREKERGEKKKWKSFGKEIKGAVEETLREKIKNHSTQSIASLPSPQHLAQSIVAMSPKIASMLLTVLFIWRIVKRIDGRKIVLAIILVAAADYQKKQGAGKGKIKSKL